MTILKIAASQLGLKEISGHENNPQIVNYARETGINGINDEEVPWCSTFINWCAKKAGLPISGKSNARSWLNIGIATQLPVPGDIVVFWRNNPQSWEGHVGIFLGFNEDGNRVFCLGGNQSNSVSVSEYDTKKVLGYRRLEAVQQLSIPEPPLKKGNEGKEVRKLQLVLNHLGYDCGIADGNFGEATEKALQALQADNLLEADGVYGKKSKNCIEALLQS